MVSMSTPWRRMSRITSRISSSVSPRPTIRPLLVGTVGNGLLEALQQFQAEGVVGARARLLVQPRHGLQVVVHHVGRRRVQDVERPIHAAAKVRRQDLDARVPASSSRTRRMQSTKCAAPPSRRSSRSTLVMTTYFSFSAAIGLGQVDRLVRIQRVGPAVADVAERAAPRALVAHDHEGRRAVAETLADVRAGGLLAHGVQVVLAQDLLDLVEARTRRTGLHANPRRLLQRRRGHHLDRNARGLGLRLLLGASAS